MNKLIRILVANDPKLMREAILATFADQPDVEIVGEVSDEAEIQDRVKETSPKLLVVTLDGSGKRLHICDMILNAHPELGIIAVSSAGLRCKFRPKTSNHRKMAFSPRRETWPPARVNFRDA